MKLLFVENRYATWIWEAVGGRLLAGGHQIHWIVENPVFSPNVGDVHLLPFPKRAERIAPLPDDPYTLLRRSDRGVRFFGLTGDYYSHYESHIAQVLDKICPDAVFGEATEFHELIAIDQCRRRCIPYLSPNSTRYPVSRTCFLAYDTLEPVGGDGTKPDYNEALCQVQEIAARRVAPSYMAKTSDSFSANLLRQSIDKIRITVGWIKGERFITPSPLQKLKLQQNYRRQRFQWEAIAKCSVPDWLLLRPWVLYPLQMQPEGNIDVWGQPWNDQAQIVREAARALARSGASLVVKPNPKSKYEISAELCEVIVSEPNVVALAHDVPMRDVFGQAPLVLTVTGTVLLECIFAGKPVASLGKHAMSCYPGVTAIDCPSEIAGVLQSVCDGRAVFASFEQATYLLQYFYATSYAANLWDPVTQPQMMTEGNIEALAQAVEAVLAHRQEPHGH